jgi:hypothetical protein
MAESVTAIVNLALTELGEELISDLSEDNKRARLANTNWALVRDAVLRSFTWPCARGRAAPGPDSSLPAGHWGWTYAFTLPNDCLRVVSLENYDDEWLVEGKKLFANSNAINMRYIMRVIDVTQYDALLDMAMAYRLAWTICFPLTQSNNLKNTLWDAYKKVVSEAKSIASQEGMYNTVVADEWLDSRIGYDVSSLRKPV